MAFRLVRRLSARKRGDEAEPAELTLADIEADIGYMEDFVWAGCGVRAGGELGQGQGADGDLRGQSRRFDLFEVDDYRGV